MENVINWLLEGEPWVQYHTRRALLNQDEDETDVCAARTEMINHPAVNEIISELADWPGIVLKSHKTAHHPLHKLVFLADLGLKQDDPGISIIIDKILKRQSSDGPFQVLANIPTHFGGTGKDEFLWMLCDAPLVTYALTKFGLKDSEPVQKSLEYLINLVRENGWPCAADSQLGKFRGPGPKTAPCPYANLLMLRLLGLYPEKHNTAEVQTGIETILELWQKQKETKPYLFAMGTDFKKLKAPLIWYDILHVTDVLSRFDTACSDQRFLEMISLIKAKADEQGRYKAESVWLKWKGWDFAQKREPSRWLTFLVLRMLRRIPGC